MKLKVRLIIILFLLSFDSSAFVFAKTSPESSFQPVLLSGENSSISGNLEIASQEKTITQSENNTDKVIFNQSGQVALNKISFPDFEKLAIMMEKSLKTLLPAKKNLTLSLPKKNLSLNINTFALSGKKTDDRWVYEKPDNISCVNAAKETADLPAYWSGFVGSLKGLSHLAPAKKLKNTSYYQTFNYDLAFSQDPCSFSLIDNGSEAVGKPLNNLNNLQSGFTISKLFTNLVSTLFDSINKVVSQILEKRVKIIPSASLPYGTMISKDSALFGGEFIPQKQINESRLGNKEKVLSVKENKGGLNANITLSTSQNKSGDLNLAKQADTRNYNCQALCSAYSAKSIQAGQVWVGENNLCPSCNIEDYKK